MTRPINVDQIRQRDNLLCDPSPGTAAHDRRLMLAHFDALVDAARNVAHRAPKCDCEMCEDAFDRLRDMLPYEYATPEAEPLWRMPNDMPALWRVEILERA